MDGNDLSRLNLDSALARRGATDLESARRAAQGDEGEVVRAFGKIFAQHLVREMRKTVEGGFFGQGSGAGIYEAWFDEHVADKLSEGDTLGLAGMIKAATPGGLPVAEAEDGAAILGWPDGQEPEGLDIHRVRTGAESSDVHRVRDEAEASEVRHLRHEDEAAAVQRLVRPEVEVRRLRGVRP